MATMMGRADLGKLEESAGLVQQARVVDEWAVHDDLECLQLSSWPLVQLGLQVRDQLVHGHAGHHLHSKPAAT